MAVGEREVTGGRDIIRSRSDYRDFLAADLAAHGVARWSWWEGLRNPELAFQRLLRRVEYLDTVRGPLGRALYLVYRVKLKRRSVVTGLSIPPGVFGRGLSIAHVGSVVVNDGAVVGRYCRLHSATNIGVYRGQAPTLGDFVYVAPGAVIYGGVSVGSRSVVGANSVVNKDVPAGVTAAGSPASVVAQNDSLEVMPSTIAGLMRAEQ